MQDHQAGAAMGQGVGRVFAHPTGPELRCEDRRVFLDPGNGPLGTALDSGEGLVERRVVGAAHLADRNVLRQRLVESRMVEIRPEHPTAGRQAERRLDLLPGFQCDCPFLDQRIEHLPVESAPVPSFLREDHVVVQRMGLGDPFEDALIESLALVKWYAREHVILCLVPAFFIAGALSAKASRELSSTAPIGRRLHVLSVVKRNTMRSSGTRSRRC